MPIEIKELHIKALVVTKKEKIAQALPVDTSRLKKEIIDECVQEVMQRLKALKER